MTASTSRSIALGAALIATTISIGAQSRDRSQTPDKFKWNLAEIYPTDAAWKTAKDGLAADLPKLRQFQGKLTSSAGTLADALDLQAGYSKTLARLYSYARRTYAPTPTTLSASRTTSSTASRPAS